ncbi:hypothetical protein QJS66_02355 [Kocuria rhizophila]|nr:hypothetical protein QJS66_02355 [Kocuria rhizophila]
MPAGIEQRPLVLNLAASSAADGAGVPAHDRAPRCGRRGGIPVAARDLAPSAARRLIVSAVRRPEIAEHVLGICSPPSMQGWRSVDRAPRATGGRVLRLRGSAGHGTHHGERCGARRAVCSGTWPGGEEARDDMLLGLTVCTADLVVLFHGAQGGSPRPPCGSG